jgi:hypothetical protein
MEVWLPRPSPASPSAFIRALAQEYGGTQAPPEYMREPWMKYAWLFATNEQAERFASKARHCGYNVWDGTRWAALVERTR